MPENHHGFFPVGSVEEQKEMFLKLLMEYTTGYWYYVFILPMEHFLYSRFYRCQCLLSVFLPMLSIRFVTREICYS